MVDGADTISAVFSIRAVVRFDGTVDGMAYAQTIASGSIAITPRNMQARSDPRSDEYMRVSLLELDRPANYYEAVDEWRRHYRQLSSRIDRTDTQINIPMVNNQLER